MIILVLLLLLYIVCSVYNRVVVKRIIIGYSSIRYITYYSSYE